MANLLIISETDAFQAEWKRLATTLSLELRVLQHANTEPPPINAVAVIVVVAGMEDRAERLVLAARAAGIDAPLIVGSDPNHRLAVGLLRAGAADYFALPGDLEVLRSRVEELRDRAAARAARGRLAETQRQSFDFSSIVGESDELRAALSRASRIISRDHATVLLTGETGTGKELLAHAIHYNGPRAAAPFVELNCAAIPATLIESELFGHEKGAFTDARSAKPGLFEAAHGGTLFLDEIGQLPYPLQGKILRALEEKSVRRVGAVAERRIDVRIIAATHVDLAAAVRNAEFREDLFYRLSIIPIHLPPLRERGRDVLLLAEHFAASIAAQYDLSTPPLSPEVRNALLAHHWPGNIRELRNAIERALLLSEGSITADDIFSPSASANTGAGPLPFPAPLATIEQEAAHAMLRHLEGNKSAAADALGISRSRFYRLLRRESDSK